MFLEGGEGGGGLKQQNNCKGAFKKNVPNDLYEDRCGTNWLM